jgi:Peptidase A4 family
MTRIPGACAAIVVALAAALTPALASQLPGGHQAGQPGQRAQPTQGVQAARGVRAPAADARASRLAPGYPDVPAALPGRTGAVAGRATAATASITSVGSLNWAGYAVSRSKTRFTAVRATFFVPYLNCRLSPGSAKSSFWVGLDGYVGHPDSVEQVGVGADCSAAGEATYFGWFEMFPYAQTRVSLKVHAGDSVTASVAWIAATKDFRLKLHDNTRGGTLSRLRKCPAVKVSGKAVRCPRNSAELIAEAPASGNGSNLVIDKLSDYGAVSFAGVSITDSAGKHGGVVSPHWNATKIIQLRQSGGPTLAQPTTVDAGDFDSYWRRED